MLSDALKKCPDIPAKSRRKVLKELQMEMLRTGLFRPDVALLFYYVSYVYGKDVEKIKVNMAGKILLCPEYRIEQSEITEEGLNLILWTIIGFIKKMGYYDDFKDYVLSWENENMVNNPLLPF